MNKRALFSYNFADLHIISQEKQNILFLMLKLRKKKKIRFFKTYWSLMTKISFLLNILNYLLPFWIFNIQITNY